VTLHRNETPQLDRTRLLCSSAHYRRVAVFSFWRLRKALQSGDSAAISSRVDFPLFAHHEEAAYCAIRRSHRWSQTMGQLGSDADRWGIVVPYATPDGSQRFSPIREREDLRVRDSSVLKW